LELRTHPLTALELPLSIKTHWVSSATATLLIAEDWQLARHDDRGTAGRDFSQLPRSRDQLRDIGVVADNDEHGGRSALLRASALRSPQAVVLLVVPVEACGGLLAVFGQLGLSNTLAVVPRPFFGKMLPDPKPKIPVGWLLARHLVVCHGTRGTFTMPDSIASISEKLGHDPREERCLRGNPNPVGKTELPRGRTRADTELGFDGLQAGDPNRASSVALLGFSALVALETDLLAVCPPAVAVVRSSLMTMGFRFCPRSRQRAEPSVPGFR